MSPAIIVFARRPRPGATKTRLIPALGAEAAARLYARLLARTLNQVNAVTAVTRYLYMDEATALPFFEPRLAGSTWHLAVQSGATLGTRMANAFEDVLGRHSGALLIGSDILDCTSVDLREALALLAQGTEAVIGPAADGGYWLLGLTRPLPALFEGISWGTATVYDATVGALAASGVRWCAVGIRHDIDTPADLARFAGELAAPSARAPLVAGEFRAELFDPSSLGAL